MRKNQKKKNLIYNKIGENNLKVNLFIMIIVLICSWLRL